MPLMANAEAVENAAPIRMVCSGGTSVIKDLGRGVVGNGCSRITTWPNERIPRRLDRQSIRIGSPPSKVPDAATFGVWKPRTMDRPMLVGAGLRSAHH